MHLSGFGGILQVDGYGCAYKALADKGQGEARVLLGARAAKSSSKSRAATPAPIAAEALAARIGALYAVEREIRGLERG